MKSTFRELWAEAIGAFVLIFAGTGAIIVNQETAALGHVGIALTFGLVVMALIYALGDVSGAHFNPAVTLAFALGGRFPWAKVPGFLIAQLLGGLSASATLHGLFPLDPLLGATLPKGTEMQSFILEMILTWFLMLTVLSVSCGAKEKGITAGLAIGAVICLEAMFAGPICGASMNPMRSLAPALVSGHLEHLWIYLAGPFLGAALALPAAWVLQGKNCCLPSSKS
jgi:aquaporin Z